MKTPTSDANFIHSYRLQVIDCDVYGRLQCWCADILVSTSALLC